MRITISSTEVTSKSGTSQKTGKPWSIREQACSAENSRMRVPAILTLGHNQEPHAPGIYEVDFEQALQVDRFGGFSLARVIPLRRVSDAKPKS